MENQGSLEIEVCVVDIHQRGGEQHETYDTLRILRYSGSPVAETLFTAREINCF